MIARKIGGYAATGAPAPALRAAALMTASREIQRSVTQPAPSGQASACKPNQQAYAPRQGFKATAPQGFEPRPVGAESVPIEDAPSVRSTDPRAPALRVSVLPFIGRLCEGEPGARIPVRLPPSRSCFESLPTLPSLLNLPKGLSMAKLPVFLCNLRGNPFQSPIFRKALKYRNQGRVKP